MEKRQRERVRQQKQSDKQQRRVQRAAERRERQLKGGKDGDLEESFRGRNPVRLLKCPKLFPYSAPRNRDHPN